MKNSKSKVWLIFMLTSLILLIAIGLINSAIEIGERLRNIHYALEIAFYVLILLIIFVGIIVPIVSVFNKPVFSLNQIHDANGNINRKWCKRLVNNLVENTDLTEEEENQVRGFLKEGNDADDRLIEFFDRKVSPEINREIFKAAKRAFIVTAVSQNSIFDMLGMASLNFMLIKRITELCGFRPNNLQVARIYIKVLSATALAGVLESINLEDLISKVTSSALGATAASIVGTVATSVIQGITNSISTLRVGFITKNYLLNADVSKTRADLRKEALKEAMSAFHEILKEDIGEKAKKPANKIKEVFSKAKDKVSLAKNIGN